MVVNTRKNKGKNKKKLSLIRREFIFLIQVWQNFVYPFVGGLSQSSEGKIFRKIGIGASRLQSVVPHTAQAIPCTPFPAKESAAPAKPYKTDSNKK